jgi:hypothetical protein
MKARSTLMALAAILLVTCIVSTTASADWSGTANTTPISVYLNFPTSFSVEIKNTGRTPLEIKSVTLNIYWSGSYTQYKVFSGSSTLLPAESRSFESADMRMPDAEPGTYSYFVAVTARAQGDARDFTHKFGGTLTADNFALTVDGIPEIFLVLTTAVLLMTFVLFRFERNQGRWPLFDAVPRWRRRIGQGPKGQ